MDKIKITVRFSTIDRYRESRTFATLAGARSYAQRKIGAHPEMGSGYAVSAWGDAKVTVSGCSLDDLFPVAARVATMEGAL